MSFSYSKLLSPCTDVVKEKSSSYHFLTERHIQAVWFEQKYFKNLCTIDGEPIRILSPGLWNSEAGPDFLKAHLAIGNREYHGDIEIHLHNGNWYDHHHEKDPRYNNVTLHLFFWHSQNPQAIVKENGKIAILASLENSLTVPIARLLQLIDLDLYPYKRHKGSGKCSQTIFNKLEEEDLTTFFISAAHWRLEQKKKYLQSRFLTPSLQLASGIAMALGYKNNAEAFVELFASLLPFRDLPEIELLSLGLGTCGFFEEKFQIKWHESDYYKNLLNMWKSIQHQATHQANLQLDHIRPLNHPVRRIVYLTKLLQDSNLEKKWSHIIELWDHPPSKINQLKEQLLSSIPMYEDPYWNSHYTFETEEKSSFLTLMGNDLKNTILVNTLLPLLHSEIQQRGSKDEWERFQLLFSSLNSQKTGKIKYLMHRFFGDHSPQELVKRSDFEQGAYQLHRDFCLHYEASCEGCPFIDRYRLLHD